MAPDLASYRLPGLTGYFSSHRANVNGDIPHRLSTFIDGAQRSLDCAIYDLKHQAVLDAFKRAGARGIQLRIVYDGGKAVLGGTQVDPRPSGNAQAIHGAALDKYATAVHATGSHLMHDKFLVRDGKVVWTGSGNFTVGGLELQDNNYLIIESPDIAKVYTQIFEAMKSDQHEKKAHTGKATGAHSAVSGKMVRLGNVSITPFFTTGLGEVENVETGILAALKGVKKIRLAAMLVSDQNILETLLAFKPADKDIQGVLDPHEMKQVMSPPGGHSQLDPKLFWFVQSDKRFVAAPSHAYHPGDSNDFMHNKFMILDDQTVVTGSYNFSEGAESNDENLVVIKSSEVAKAYSSYFDALFKQYSENGAKLPPA